jgi:hypothetical protein
MMADETPDPATCDHIVGFRQLSESDFKSYDKVVHLSEMRAGTVVEKWAKYCGNCGARLREGKVING